MKDFTVMILGDEQSPVRRFHVPEKQVRRLTVLAVLVVVLSALGMWDYWRLRAGSRELASLRIEAAEQREQIRVFEDTLVTVQGELERVQQLERKVRIIANLPGAAATGGPEVTEIPPPPGAGGSEPRGEEALLPTGWPENLGSDLGPRDLSQLPLDVDVPQRPGLTTPAARQLHRLDGTAQALGSRAGVMTVSLEDLVARLESKRSRLAAMPSIWPARGWITSRFGHRVSPFTGKRQRHNGIDIAARRGTPVIAPARGRVKFVGSRGSLGKTLVIDHGHGIQTVYGHNDSVTVKIGQEVARGQQIASIGSSGRSTGPHLHYIVEVRGKAMNPLNYIFD